MKKRGRGMGSRDGNGGPAYKILVSPMACCLVRRPEWRRYRKAEQAHRLAPNHRSAKPSTVSPTSSTYRLWNGAGTLIAGTVKLRCVGYVSVYRVGILIS